MTADRLEQEIAGVASLGEPARRKLYLYVAGRPGDVSRDQAARAAGISRSLAAFHLDRLVKEGLLEASFRRLSGHSGPGAGRPAKLYRRSERQVELSLPQRKYELAARILATAIDTSDAPKARKALVRTARNVGEHIGAEVRARAGPRPGRKRLLSRMAEALAGQGYEPETAAGELRLRNCPFHALVNEHRDLVCGMNLALIEGVVEGLDLPDAKPVLAPAPGRCCVCVRLGKTTPSGAP
jgi:predicted ArsR family transcriptional regulator